MIKPTKPLMIFSLAAALITGCSGVEQSSSSADTEVSGAVATSVNLWPQVASGVAKDPQLEAEVDALLARMTLEQKVGQVIQPELRTTTPEDVRDYHIGSFLNGGGSFPNDDKYAEPADWLAIADAFFEASMDTRDGGLAIPIMWGTDAVHGHNNVYRATIFPHNIGLGATNNPDLIREIMAATAREMAVTGKDWNFSPSVAVARDDRWGRTYEAYAEGPDLVNAYAGEAVIGLQGEPGSDQFLAGGRAIATAKHFIGDGATIAGIDRGDAVDAEADLRDLHGAGYFSAIEAGVQTIMASFNSWHGEKLHGHHYLLTEVLKERMGFDGVIVGDWNGHEFVDGCTRNSCAQAFNAGVDIFMAPDDWKVLYANTLAQVKSGEITLERLDDAVRRILRVKKRAGLFEKGTPSERQYAGQAEVLGHPEHRAIARQAVRESLVLLKNDNGILPLARDSRVLVAGDGGHNIGKQSGGWTLTWQGTGNSNDDFPNGDSIFDGIAEAVNAAGGTAVLNETGEFDEKPDVAIVVFGEDPYAEMQGDLSHLAYSDERHLAMIRDLQAQDIPVVSLFITGRPLWINPFLNASDAFAVVWLPGTEGAGIADVILRDANGEVNHDFTGRLTFSWPKTAVQSPLNQGADGYDPLFPYGYGLRYSDAPTMTESLSEESGISDTDGTQVLDIFRDRAMDPWHMEIADGTRAALPVTGSSATLPGIRLQSIDRLVQEDSRRVQWLGQSLATVRLTSSQRTNLTPYLQEGAVLHLDYRVYKAPTASVMMAMNCGESCGGALDITEHLSAEDDWQTLSIELACFEQAGVEPALVLTPFSLQTQGELDLTFHRVSIDVDGEAHVTCVQ
ncbi:glycoside hydrolase family 3 protein [Marinimicrobium alkaliphilum]|uniref:glycoside hydrolase family 3 protein n=1 Tax=Marinimicrobium alkaliphilum TaxID=2202654 RepID=UPI000DB9DEA0|nr:glycoside hydrolase family 3 N-terminal domain-containing protein [Marinimicrobium alkaliphilum]